MNMNEVSPKKRAYTMSARAQAARETEQRVLDVALRLFSEQLYDAVSLEQIAEQAQVTVQTIIRRFGSKELLFDRTLPPRMEQVYQDRMNEAVGDVEDALESLLRHYERWGQLILHLQFQKERVASIEAAVTAGRNAHKAWLKRSFAAQLEKLSTEAYRVQFAQLMIITDVFTWHTLRHEQSLSEEEIREVLRSLLGVIAIK
ncbi:MAG: TetR/AcrR family transcriptional regulator [Ktedonobacteraceae bacterium]|nr:TetR/AcrR family transcriptional regulator [Ktedonobacteraceae bacterium]